MTEFVFARKPRRCAGARQQRKFPVRRVYCVGRSYAAHAREMGSDPDREPPFFFCKPSDAVSYVADNTEGARSRTRRAPATATTKWNWWWPSARAAGSRSNRPPAMSTAMRSAST
jgi:hypothetical protein